MDDIIERVKYREERYKKLLQACFKQMWLDKISVKTFIKEYITNLEIDGDEDNFYQFDYAKSLGEKKLKYYTNLTLLTDLIISDDLDPIKIYRSILIF